MRPGELLTIVLLQFSPDVWDPNLPLPLPPKHISGGGGEIGIGLAGVHGTFVPNFQVYL